MVVMLTRLRGGGGRPACYHCTSPRSTRGVSGRFWGREKSCRGPRGKVWSALRSGCIRPSACVVVRPLHPSSLPLYHVLVLIFLPGWAIQLLWMCLSLRDPLLLWSFWRRKLSQIRIGSSFNASAVSVWSLASCFPTSFHPTPTSSSSFYGSAAVEFCIFDIFFQNDC